VITALVFRAESQVLLNMSIDNAIGDTTEIEVASKRSVARTAIFVSCVRQVVVHKSIASSCVLLAWLTDYAIVGMLIIQIWVGCWWSNHQI
jgi:hypothetical protein